MKLSEQLRDDHNCGDYGLGLKGYSERAESLENKIIKLILLIELSRDNFKWIANNNDTYRYVCEQKAKSMFELINTEITKIS